MSLNNGFWNAGINSNSSLDQAKIKGLEAWNRRRFAPWYSAEADYNTNAKSYYDYLGRRAYNDDVLNEIINRLLRREIATLVTPSVTMSQDGTWETEDDITLKADANISTNTHNFTFNSKNWTLPNSIDIETTGSNGLYSPDYSQLLNDLYTDYNNLQNEYNQLKGQLDKIINNLIGSGAWSGDPETGDLVAGRDIATGNINVFSAGGDSNYFIRTNKGQTENDLSFND